MNMKNLQGCDFDNGSFIKTNGIEISAQGKFEMLQSSIYPDSYGVPCEYFFVIKIQLEGTPELANEVELRKIHLKISDKSRNKTTNELQTVFVHIDRDLTEKNEDQPNQEEDLILRPNGKQKEHNILLYVENLGAKVTGYIEYKDLGDKNPESENKKVNIKEFNLDLLKG